MTRYVYLAGPMTGLTHAAADTWRTIFADAIKVDGWTALSPTDTKAKPHLSEKYAEDVMPARVHHDTEKQEVGLDFEWIDRSEAVIANLQHAKIVSIGTVSELAYAYAKGKSIIVVDRDESPHDHMFVRQMATVTVPNLLQARLVLSMVTAPTAVAV